MIINKEDNHIVTIQDVEAPQLKILHNHILKDLLLNQKRKNKIKANI